MNNTRTYGIEIECVMGGFYRGYNYHDDSHSDGISDYDGISDEFEGLFPNWKHMDEHCGIELKSPILKGSRDMGQVAEVCAWLKSNGAETTRSCGLHVHHGAGDLSKQDILRIVKSWYANQKEIDLMLHTSRRTSRSGHGYNEWCKGWTKANIEKMERIVAGNDPYSHSFDGFDRYKSINVCSLSYHGTLEIRQHEATLDADEIDSWVNFGQSFIESVAKKRKRAMVAAKETPILLDRIRVPKKNKDFYAKKMAMANR